jgi:hypothetical protein
MPGSGAADLKTDDYPFNLPPTVYRVKAHSAHPLVWLEELSQVVSAQEGDFPIVEVYREDFLKKGPLAGKVFIATDEEVLAAWNTIKKSWDKAIKDEEAQNRKNREAFRVWKRAMARLPRKPSKPELL